MAKKSTLLKRRWTYSKGEVKVEIRRLMTSKKGEKKGKSEVAGLIRRQTEGLQPPRLPLVQLKRAWAITSSRKAYDSLYSTIASSGAHDFSRAKPSAFFRSLSIAASNLAIFEFKPLISLEWAALIDLRGSKSAIIGLIRL
nr:hypothetical protein Iba_chr13dCG7880 [Ipomoea batatas]